MITARNQQYAAEHQHPDPDDAPPVQDGEYCHECGCELFFGVCLECREEKQEEEA